MTESTIDMDRAMQGIDCEIITWTKCADEMPPDDKNFKLIFREIASGRFEENDGFHMNLTRMKYLFEWTPYTPEAWEELNRK